LLRRHIRHDWHGTIKMIEVVESFDGFDPSVIWPGIKFDFKNIRNISHVAVVSDIGWLSPLAKAAGALLSTKLRAFSISELDDAREWIKSV
jgi:SpoIIAA-like